MALAKFQSSPREGAEDVKVNPQLSRAAKIVSRMRLDPLSAFSARPPQGALRGIDVYPAETLVRAIAYSLHRYEQATGEQVPDPERATLLREKIFWSKFFRPMQIPTQADKLAIYSMLSTQAKSYVQEPPKIWQSDKPELPSNDSIQAGNYFLKTNHACSTNERVIFPLDAEQRAALQAKVKKWLQWDFGWRRGEWWYTTIQRRLYLEKELNLPEQHPGEFKFHVVNGEVTHLHVNWYTPEGRSTSIYNRDLTFLDLRYKHWPNARKTLCSRISDLVAVAEELATGIDYVRVDLYLDQNDTVWLGEFTFSPSNAVGRYSSRGFESECCRDWDMVKYLRPTSREFD
jgi:TupA-like ATPgrasp